ncbi:hypothetical protein EG68_11656 [Paragonimus skrjabini miyazakii]|uniref:Biotin-protein ligase N-terminal domain-containing protein n=1 Tax=Paragonimus skrjabini miyazakii TaxID=59628 RepID=A0A8S9YM29_9TREM|nr:hypothetical protein EG68_11656 [Paragonimus skrjabini miyazakii]
MARTLIQVYGDVGAGQRSLLQLQHALRLFSPKFTVIETDGKRIRERYRLDETALLCFGGGFDLGYLRSLEMVGCEIVRDFILHGGRYLGLCAGAYFASDECIFDKGGPLEVCGPRHVKLFEGKAVGPYYPGFVYESEEGACAISVVATNPSVSPTSAVAYFNGGVNTNDAAVVACRLGKGWGILSGVHLEYDPALLRTAKTCKPTEAVLTALESDNANRQRLWENLIGALLDPDCNLVDDLVPQ